MTMGGGVGVDVSVGVGVSGYKCGRGSRCKWAANPGVSSGRSTFERRHSDFVGSDHDLKT